MLTVQDPATPATPPARATLTPPAAVRHSALPRTGVVLVGTAPTVRLLDQMLQSLPQAPVIAGCVLIDTPLAPNSAEAPPADLPDLPVVSLGSLADLALLTPRLNLKCAVICLPRAQSALATRAAQACRDARLDVRILPTVADLLDQPGPDAPALTNSTVAASVAASPAPAATWSATPAIDLARLIDRAPHSLDRDAVAKILTGKRVLITGAGGSIGSELARVAAEFNPARLILMDRGENALFEIDRVLGARFPAVPRRALLHDVVDAEGTMRLLQELRPHTVFHAAAHKHVPLMEDHPAHAVNNNLFGTKSIADAAVFAGAERFVMISSDKAVNPTSVMGATKRLAEMYIQALAHRPDAANTRMSMVRFGNVLGSAASVLTIWSQQIAEGGPITVTDPRMTRYFMTIPEAATLVMQSATLDLPNQSNQPNQPCAGVFVLDMGEPIAIAELAARFVVAHGLSPRLRLDGPVIIPADLEDRLTRLAPASPLAPTIDIVFTGIRPGEKLYEQLAYAAENLRPTAHPGVQAWGGQDPGDRPTQTPSADTMIRDFAMVRHAADRHAVLSLIRTHVPEMRPPTPPASSATHPVAG